jgi:DTW domain-containing protein YfiP
VCSRCRRAQSVCYCHKIPQLPTKTKVVILQHPRERDKAIGTARMASLCLPDSELHVGVRWGEHAALARALSDETRPAALLFPGPGAKDILTERPPGPITLVVVDGTWSQAKTVVRDNPILQALPRYAFATPEPSQYRIRKEPNDQFVSTIEALMHVLGVLEGDPGGFRALLEPFRAMVDMQLHCQATRPQRRFRQERGPRPERPRLPPALTSRFEDLVCVVGEANAWPYKKDASHEPDELVHWVAVRVATGERFEQLAAPRNRLSPNTAFHARLDAATLGAAGSREALFAAFAAFTRPSDIIAAWGHYGPNLYRECGGTLAPHHDLRALCQRLVNKKFGSLEDAAGSVGPPREPLGMGRGGVRLAALVQLVEHWRATYPR